MPKAAVAGGEIHCITPSYFSEALAQAIPGAILVTVKGGGHSFTTTRPDEFNRHLMAFLARR